jgi:hypothetical protein
MGEQLLRYLRGCAGRTVTYSEIAGAVGGFDLCDESDRRLVRLWACRARPSLAPGERLRSVRGVGYVYEAAACGPRYNNGHGEAAVPRDEDLRLLQLRSTLQ